MTCSMCQGKCCRDVDSGYCVEHMAAEVYLHACDCADGTWVNPDAQALDEVTAEARRLSTAVDRLEGESLEVLAALGLHEDTPHDKVLAHVRALVKEHAEMRTTIEEVLAHIRALVKEHAEMRTTIEQHKAFWKDLP